MKEVKTCPACLAFGTGKIEIKKMFSFREYRGKRYYQSYCRVCRDIANMAASQKRKDLSSNSN